MTSLIKNKMTATALAVCTVLGMGYSAMASAASVNFTASIAITSPNTCEIETTAPATSAWDLTWTLTNAGDASGALGYGTSSITPLFIKAALKAGGAANCTLNGVVAGATAAGGNVNAVTGQPGYFRAESDESGAFWRYAPTIAQVKMFTDDNFTTPAAGDITVTDAKGTDHTQSPTALYTHHADINSLAGMNNNPAVGLTDNYLAATGDSLLAGAQNATIKSETTDAVKSVEIGVSALIAKDPENSNGVVDTGAVVNDEQITMPFTVNVEYR